jgi:hypothetical protein
MKKQILNEEFKRMQKLAGIINENEDSLENKIKQWVANDAGGYGPEESDSNYSEFKNKMDELLSDTLEDFNLDNYGDSTSMSPDEILENFITDAISIIADYTMDYYGDDTSFSPEEIKAEFYSLVK